MTHIDKELKVFALAPNEDWIIDRIVERWNKDNGDISTQNVNDANVIWLAADFCWTHLPFQLLQSKKVVTTIHHIVPEKFNTREQYEFAQRDIITDTYHVPNFRTRDFIRKFTNKPIICIPYWAEQDVWARNSESTTSLRTRYGIPQNNFVIMSAQRDTEGYDLKTPKFEKGPDLFADAVIEFSKKRSNLTVLLGGWRREYVIRRLKEARIDYKYIERPMLNVVRDMYQMSDLYFITARHEGGPQALIECGLMGLPCVSTPVGMAEIVLPDYSINVDVTKAIPEIPNVYDMQLPQGFIAYRNMFQKLYLSAV